MNDFIVATKIKVNYSEIILRVPTIIFLNKISMINPVSTEVIKNNKKIMLHFTNVVIDGISIDIEEKIEDIFPEHIVDKYLSFLTLKKLSN